MLTKEEEARQRFLFFLIVNCKYPLEFIEVEYSIKDENDNKSRADIVIFNSKKEALIVIECKEGNVKLSQKVFDQVKKYNEVLKARYIIVANELYYSIRIFNDDKKRYEVISEIPKI